MKTLGHNLSESVLQEMVNFVDVDKNGTIEFPEFLQMIAKETNEVDHEKEVREAFNVFDKDGNGFISPSELKLVLNNLGYGDDAVEEIIKKVDANNDGQVDYEGDY